MSKFEDPNFTWKKYWDEPNALAEYRAYAKAKSDALVFVDPWKPGDILQNKHFPGYTVKFPDETPHGYKHQGSLSTNDWKKVSENKWKI